VLDRFDRLRRVRVRVSPYWKLVNASWLPHQEQRILSYRVECITNMHNSARRIASPSDGRSIVKALITLQIDERRLIVPIGKANLQNDGPGL
jgi:hypothetical protein